MQQKIVILNLILLGWIFFVTGCSSSQHMNKNFYSSLNNKTKINYGRKIHNHVLPKINTIKHAPIISDDNVIYFALDKYDIKSCFIQMLDEYAQFLRSNPLDQLIIEGHADERGTPEYNIALGERRANAVKRYLQSQGVCSEQIKIISYGKEKPAIFGHNEAAYAKNRRAILIY